MHVPAPPWPQRCPCKLQARTWNLKSRNFGIVILAPSKFHDVEIPRFQQKSWNREFEAQTRKLGIVILAFPCRGNNSHFPRFRHKSWNREFESQTRKLGIVILHVAYTVLPVHSVGKCIPNLGIWDFDLGFQCAGGRNCKWEFRNYTKAGASSYDTGVDMIRDMIFVIDVS